MKVAIVTSYAASQPAGLERFLLDLLQALDARVGATYMVYTKKGNGLAAALKEKEIKNISVVEIGFGRWWKEIGLFFKPRAEAYIFNGPIVPAWFVPKNYFVILQDFAYKYIEPRNAREKIKRMLLDWFTRRAVARADKVIAVSETSKQETIALFGCPKDRIVTIYPGFRSVCTIAEEPVPAARKPYFLYVSTLKERKNVISIVQAFAEFKKQAAGAHSLVIAGKHNPLDSYVQKLHRVIAERNIAGDVIFTGYVTDGQISSLYQNAEALVFPSLIEGFGLPVLEAMSCRVPVITSNTGSLEEIGRGAALLVDPLNTAEIAAAMQAIVSDQSLRARLVVAGSERIKLFSWPKTAQAIEELVVRSTKLD